MTTSKQAEQQHLADQKHLVDVLEDFDTAMLTTRTQSGELRARPMALAEIRPTGNVVFATSLSNETVREIEAEPRAAVTVQGKVKFASVSGRARISRDRGRIESLWKEGWKLWFPEGKDDPALCLIEFAAGDGEYWDNSGTRGVRFALRAAKAYVSGERLEGGDPSTNAKVHLR
jgi:general stress protein 26